MMPSFAFSEDYGNPSQNKSVTSLYKEKLVNVHNEWKMNESVEELLEEEQETYLNIRKSHLKKVMITKMS